MKPNPILALSFLASASAAFAATVPYSDAFQSSSTAGWTTGGSSPATWAIVDSGGSNVYQVTSSNVAGNFSSTVQLTNINSALENFTISTTFKITDTTVAQFVGLAAFSNNVMPGAGSNYLADIDAAGNMRILAQNDSSGFTSTTADFGPNLALGTSYTMSLSGAYTGTTLNLTYTVSSGILSQSVTATDTSPLAGQYFGYRLNNGTANNPLQVQFSNFTASTIPEPASAVALFGLATLGLAVATRRRRRAV